MQKDGMLSAIIGSLAIIANVVCLIMLMFIIVTKRNTRENKVLLPMASVMAVFPLLFSLVFIANLIYTIVKFTLPLKLITSSVGTLTFNILDSCFDLGLFSAKVAIPVFVVIAIVVYCARVVNSDSAELAKKLIIAFAVLGLVLCVLHRVAVLGLHIAYFSIQFKYPTAARVLRNLTLSNNIVATLSDVGTMILMSLFCAAGTTVVVWFKKIAPHSSIETHLDNNEAMDKMLALLYITVIFTVLPLTLSVGAIWGHSIAIYSAASITSSISSLIILFACVIVLGPLNPSVHDKYVAIQ